MSGSDYRVEQAARYHDSGQAQAAIELLAELLAEQPDDALLHGLLASCLLQEKRMVAAEYENQLALGMDPLLPFLHQVRARILLHQRKLHDALASCDEALRLEPDSVDCHLIKMSIYLLLDKRDAALASLAQAASLEPGNLDVAIAYGDYYNSMGKHETALQYATDALRLNPESDAANVLMGETHLALGNSEEADYHAKFAITRNPTSEEALQLFVDIRMRKNWFVGAWWRFNSWIATLGNLKAALVLIGAYLAFNIFSEIAADTGYPTTSSVLAYAWLALVVYSWVGLPMYRKAMARELEKFTFNPKF